MKKESSNNKMDLNIDILNTVKRVDVPEHVYNNILQKIEQKRTSNVIPMKWVGAAAAVLLCLISLEVYVFTKESTSNKNNLESIVELPNNMLYNE